MPVIPTYEAETPLDPDRRGMPVVELSTAEAQAQGNAAKALEGVGANVSDLFDHMAKQQEEKENLAASIGLQSLDQNIKLSDTAAANTMSPDGSGWTTARTANAGQLAQNFVQTLPPRLQQEYGLRTGLLLQKQQNDYASQELYQSNLNTTNAITQGQTGQQNDLLTNFDHNNLVQYQQDLNTQIANSGLPPEQKLKLQNDLGQKLSEAGAYGLAQQNPAAAQLALAVPTPLTPASPPVATGPATAPANPVNTTPIAGVTDISKESTFNGGPLQPVQGFIFHHTGSDGTPDSIVQTLNQRGLGVQYIMDRDGKVYQALPDGARGAHILPSSINNLTNANSIGMEVIAKNDADVTPAQVTAARAFAQTIEQQYPGIQFFGHGEVNPGHKQATEGLTIANAVRGDLDSPQQAPAGGGSPASAAVTPVADRTLGNYMRGNVGAASPSLQGGQPQPGDAGAAAGPDPASVADIAMRYFLGNGWTKPQAAGIVGNLLHESGGHLNPNAVNPGDGSDGSNSVGVGQWNGSRGFNLLQFASATNANPNDLKTQLAFTQWELTHTEKAAGDAIRATSNVQDATAAAALKYERPAGSTTGDPTQVAGWQSRLAYAQRAAGDSSPPPPNSAPASFMSGENPAFTGPDPAFANLPFEKRLSIAQDIQRKLHETATAQQAQQKADHDALINQAELAAHDGKLGMADIQTMRQNGQLTQYADVSKLEGIITKRDQDVQALSSFNQAIGTPGFQWNPYDPDHTKMVDAGYDYLAQKEGQAVAAQHVVQQTGILPTDAGVALRGSMVADIPHAQAALQAGSSLLRQNPTIFTSMKGGSDFADQVTTFDHYTKDLGMPSDVAAGKIFQAQQPEYQQKVKAIVKGEDVDKLAKDNLSPNDLSQAFSDGWKALGQQGTPSVDLTPALRRETMIDYTDLFKQAFEQNGDINAAKAVAIGQMKRIWGVSGITGSPVLMRYPMDKAPAYQNVDDAAGRIAGVAIQQVKAESGADVDRGHIFVTPGPDTAQAYVAGLAPPMQLGWMDGNGLMHMSQTPLHVDPAALLQQQVQDRSATPEAIYSRGPMNARTDRSPDPATRMQQRTEDRQEAFDRIRSGHEDITTTPMAGP